MNWGIRGKKVYSYLFIDTPDFSYFTKKNSKILNKSYENVMVYFLKILFCPSILLKTYPISW